MTCRVSEFPRFQFFIVFHACSFRGFALRSFVCPRLRFLPPGVWKMHVGGVCCFGLVTFGRAQGQTWLIEICRRGRFSLRSRFSVPGLFLLARPEGMRAVYRRSSSSYNVLTGLVVRKLPCRSAMRQPLSLKAHIAVHVHGGRELFRDSQSLTGWS